MNAQLMQSNVWRPTTVFFLLSFFHIQQNDRIAELHKRRLKLGTDHQTIQTSLLLNNFSAINQKLSWAGKCIVSLDRHSVIICKLYFSCFKNRKKTQKALPLSLSLSLIGQLLFCSWMSQSNYNYCTTAILYRALKIVIALNVVYMYVCTYLSILLILGLSHSLSLFLNDRLSKWRTMLI